MNDLAPLFLLSRGEKAKIVEVGETKERSNGNMANHIYHAEDMGLRTGHIIEMLHNGGRGPLLVKVDESRIAISREMAMMIIVKRMT